jgi:transmembrane sensor
MSETNFDELMKRYLTGQVSEPERVKIEAWLEVKKTEDAADEELSVEDEERLFQKIVASTQTVDEVKAFRPWHKRSPTSPWVMRIAAVLVLVATMIFAVSYFKSDKQRIMYTSSGAVKKILLADGSLVWLRGISTLSYEIKDGNRITTFQGDALFEVAKDASHPFLIQCGDATIRVLGTSFNVHAANDSLEVGVLTGKVNVSSHTGSINIEPHQKAVLVSGNAITQSLPQQEVSHLIAQTQYDMKFADATLNQVIVRLAEKFDATITVIDNTVNNCHIAVDLTDNSLEGSLQMITEILDVEYNIQDRKVTLSGKGCQ